MLPVSSEDWPCFCTGITTCCCSLSQASLKARIVRATPELAEHVALEPSGCAH